MIPYPIETKLLHKFPRGKGVGIPNLKKIALAISEIRAAKVWVYFLLLLILLFAHFAKSAIKHECVLQSGTHKGLIKADLSTNFGRNPMNIRGVITNYSRKKKVEGLSRLQGKPLEGMS